MALDSDVINADSQLHVEFYEHDKEGPYKGKPFVRIIVPGDKTSIIDQPVREDHKRRFPRQWLFFQMKNAEGTIIGTPLASWRQERPEELSDGQFTELAILKFQSVEQVATASDSQIQRVGMGAAGLRERARLYLSSKNAQANGAELTKAQAEIAELRAMVMKLAAPDEAVKAKAKGWPKGKKRAAKNKGDQNDNHASIGAASL